MARKMLATEVAKVLEKAKKTKNYAFVLQAVVTASKTGKHIHSHLRLLGSNGAIVMNQECTSAAHARYMAARLIKQGKLYAKYNEVIVVKPVVKSYPVTK